MELQIPTGSIPVLFLVGYILAAVVTTAFAIFVVKSRRDQPAALAFGAIATLLAIWACAYIGRLFAPSLAGKLLWTQLAWVGITLTPVAVLSFVLIFTGRTRLVSNKIVAGLVVLPLITQGMLLTNRWHHLLYEDVWLHTADGMSFIASRGGFWFYGVHLPYSWGLYFIATILLVQFAFTTRHIYRSQVIALVFGAIFPWFVNGTFLAGWRLHPELDPTPVAVAIGMLAIGLAVFRVEFLGLIPVAHEKVVDEMDTSIFVLDDNDRIVDVNTAGERFLDQIRGTDWAIGTPASQAFPPDLWRPDSEPASHPTEEEVHLNHEDADTWYLLRRQRLGHPIYLGELVTLIDISAQKRQHQLLEQKNRYLEELAGVMSHDLRNPLGIATGFLRHLDTELEEMAIPSEEEEELHEAIEHIELAHERMSTIIEEMMSLARSGGSVVEPTAIELEDLAHLTWNYVETNGIELIVESSDTIRCDRDRLLRVFENVFRNTVEHGHNASTIWVGMTEDGFYVEDDGSGDSSARDHDVFERGVSGTVEGTGLGLFIVRNVVEAHGWEVEVSHSTRGGFRVEISGVDLAAAAD